MIWIPRASARWNQSMYVCSCGLQLNTNLNASQNIKNIWRRANGYASGQPVNLPIVTDIPYSVTSSLL